MATKPKAILSPKKAPPTPKHAAEWKPAFLASIKEDANVRAACKAAGVSRQSAYAARDADPAFAALWQSALDDAIDDLEAAARKRALEMSDTLIIFLLKSHRPSVYRDVVRQEVTGADAAPLTFSIGIDRRDGSKE